MLSNLFIFLSEYVVPQDELGKYWVLFEIIAITIAVLPWIGLIIYLLFFRVYNVNYYVDNKLVYTCKFHKNRTIFEFQYKGIKEWYTDPECTILLKPNTVVTKNIKLYANTQPVDPSDI